MIEKSEEPKTTKIDLQQQQQALFA